MIASFVLPVYAQALLNVSHWRRSLSGFRRVHALGGVNGTPVMTRTMALHSRLTGRAQDAIRPGAGKKPST